MVGAAEGAGGDEAGAVDEAGDGVDFGGLDGFVEGHAGEDGGKAAREHGLAGAWGADEEDVIA